MRSLLFYVREYFPSANVFTGTGPGNKYCIVLRRSGMQLIFVPNDPPSKLYTPEEVIPILDEIEKNMTYQVDMYYEPEQKDTGSKAI